MKSDVQVEVEEGRKLAQFRFRAVLKIMPFLRHCF